MLVTRDTLRKIRQAHGLFVHAEGETATLTLDLESTFGKPYDEVARCRFELPLARRVPEDRRAFFSKSSIRQSAEWMTIASLLRVGDRLSLEFQMDWHSNGYTQAARGNGYEAIGSGMFRTAPNPEFNATLLFEGLHVDTVVLWVERNKRRLCFHLDTSICPENSARMVKLRNL